MKLPLPIVPPPEHPSQLSVVLLCGGKGTRAYPDTHSLPKPLLRLGGREVLGHIMDHFATFGVTRFVLAAGYLASEVERFASQCPSEWSVTVVDSGVDAGTATRIRSCLDQVDETFLATYGDGVSDVDIAALLSFHRQHPGGVSLTSVPLVSQFGLLDLDSSGQVSRFREKPRLDEHRINAGYFVFDRELFRSTSGDDLEREILPSLAAAGNVYAFLHNGFWRSMDTQKDVAELDSLFVDGPPWKNKEANFPQATNVSWMPTVESPSIASTPERGD